MLHYIARHGHLKIAKLVVVLGELAERRQLVATGVRCWGELEHYYSVAPCLATMRADRKEV